MSMDTGNTAKNGGEQTYAAFIGIEEEEGKYAVAVHDVGSGATETISLARTPEDLDRWATQLRQRFGEKRIAICLSPYDSELADALQRRENHVLFPIRCTALMAYFGETRNDKTMAQFRCQVLREHWSKLAHL
jgi:hypothetical protein